jgi:hypothetical protein
VPDSRPWYLVVERRGTSPGIERLLSPYCSVVVMLYWVRFGTKCVVATPRSNPVLASRAHRQEEQRLPVQDALIQFGRPSCRDVPIPDSPPVR